MGLPTSHVSAVLRRVYLLSRSRLRAARFSSFFLELHPQLTVNGGWLPRTWLDRAVAISSFFSSRTLRVHRGKRWRRLTPRRWHLGFAWAAFARTQTLAVFRKRAARKKKKQGRGSGDPQAGGLGYRITELKSMKSGAQRRTLAHYRVNSPLMMAATLAAQV
jgi:hypothetical protein